MSIRAITFNEQLCTSEDDALIHDLFLNGHIGKLTGCAITNDSNSITIGTGYFMIAGRLVNINGDHTIDVGSSEVTKKCQLLFSLDMSKENTVVDFNQGKFEIIKDNTDYQELTQEDIHNGGKIYQMEIARFELVPDTGINNLEITWGNINYQGIFDDVDAKCDELIAMIYEKALGAEGRIDTEEGVHGLRYLDKSFWVYNVENKTWEKISGSLPPRQVNEVYGFIDGSSIKIVWDKPETYDVDIAKYNVYVYHGSSAPTELSQFTKIATTTSNTYTYSTTSTSDCYVLVTSVSASDVENEKIDYVKKAQTKPTFSSATYKIIHLLGKLDVANEYFAVGDTKSVSIGGTSYKLAVYDFKHDDLADGTGKAKMTIGLLNCLSATNQMNASDTNVGGYSSSKMHSYLETVYEQLPDDLKAVIKPVKKKTSAGNNTSTIVTSTEKIFLFSEVEVFGSTSYSYSGEGSQYSIFTNSSSRIKKQGDSGSAIYWWERSPRSGGTTAFCSVNSSGSANIDGASYMNGVCFGFCI